MMWQLWERDMQDVRRRLTCARLGLETIIFTVSVDSIALMPCNPNIGGSSKGHLVREIDALGGQMGINIDKTFIQSKMLEQIQRDLRFIRCGHRRIRQITAWRCGIHYRIRSI